LKFLEESKVKLNVSDSSISVSKLDGRDGVKASIGVCGTLGSGSIPDSGPIFRFKSKNEK
jgi:hypothetical protein